MPARDNLAAAARSTLPTALPASYTGTVTDLDARFVEATELLVLALAADMNAPYALAYRASARLQELLSGIYSEVGSLYNLLNTPKTVVKAPVAGRDFELMKDSISRVGDSLVANKMPDAEDLATFVSAAQNHAVTQLVPVDSTLPPERLREQLQRAVDNISTDLEEAHTLIRNLSPDTFFVDDLPETLASAQQFGITVLRLRDLVTKHEVWLKDTVASSRLVNASQMLAETAAMISAVKSLSKLQTLAERYRLAFTAYAVSEVAGSQILASSPATLSGVVLQGIDADDDPFLALESGAELVLEVNKDSRGSVSNTVTIPLTAATAPSTIALTGASWTFAPSALSFYLGAELRISGQYVSFFGSFVLVPTYADELAPAAPQEGDYGYFLDSSTTKRYSIGVWGAHASINVDNTVTLLPSEVDNYLLDVRNVLTGSDASTVDFADMFDIVGVDGLPGSLTFTIKPSVTWRERGADISVTVGTNTASYSEQGTSPSMATILADIDSATDLVVASYAPGRILRLSTALSGAVFEGDSAWLRVTTQPEDDGTPIFGLPTTGVTGSVNGLYAPSGGFLSAGILPQAILDSNQTPVVSVLSDKILTTAAIPASSTLQSEQIWAAGAVSYESSIGAAEVQWTEAASLIPTDTSVLQDLLSQALFSDAAVEEALRYLGQAFVDYADNTGPIPTLLAILLEYFAPESEALASAIAMLRERGFSSAVDILLQGRVADALDTVNSSHARALKQSLADIGLTL